MLSISRFFVRSHLTRSLRVLATNVVLLVTPCADAAPGDLDASFGDHGRVIIDDPQVYEAATALAQQSDGKLLVGRDEHLFASGDIDFSVVRLNADGSLDTTFGKDGATKEDFAIGGTTAAVLAQPDGRILAAGPASGQFAVVRYEANGRLDPTFGPYGQGMAVLDVSSAAGMSDATADVRAIVLQPDERVVLAGTSGYSSDDSSDMALVRLNPDGAPDLTFGTDAVVLVDFGQAGRADGANAVIRQTDGRVVAAGYTKATSELFNMAVVRVLADGRIDPSFGVDGRVTISFAEDQSSAAALVLHSDGRLTVAGHAGCAVAMARLNPDGSLDATFADNGRLTFGVGDCVTVAPGSLVLDSNDATVVAGAARGSGQLIGGDAFVARVIGAGALDEVFGVNGIAIVELGQGSYAGTAESLYDGPKLLRQTDRKLVVGVSDAFDYDFGGTFFMIARLLANGGDPGLLGFTQSWWSMDEGTGAVTLTLRRTGGSSGPVTVDYATVNDSAEDGSDFTAMGGTLEWADGDAGNKTISIAIRDDAQFEDTEHFAVALSNPSGGAGIATGTALIAIADDDPEPGTGAPPPTNSPTPTGDLPGNGGGGALSVAMFLLLPLAFVRCRMRPAHWALGLLSDNRLH